jgi:hypothetical protein
MTDNKKVVYTICYSSPYYYLYNEDKNELILKSYFEKEVQDLKQKLEEMK